MRTPISGAGRARCRTAQGGFTLVELMVVVAIIGLASAAVVIAMPDPRGGVRSEAARLAIQLSGVRDAAIVEGRAIRVRVGSGGYVIERRSRGAWQAARAEPVRFGQGIAAVGDKTATFDSTGAVGEETLIELGRGETRASVSVTADGRVQTGG